MSKVTLVLGAGIIGVSTAIHLARRGRSVVLVDRRGAGEETSFGNAGLIQREGVVPYGFPQELGMLIRYGFNNRIDARVGQVDWNIIRRGDQIVPGLTPGSSIIFPNTRQDNLRLSFGIVIH